MTTAATTRMGRFASWRHRIDGAWLRQKTDWMVNRRVLVFLLLAQRLEWILYIWLLLSGHCHEEAHKGLQFVGREIKSRHAKVQVRAHAISIQTGLCF